MTLPHVLRNGGPKRRSTKVHLINPQPTDFQTLGYFIPGDTITYTRDPVGNDETTQMIHRFSVLNAHSIRAELYGAAGGACNMQNIGVGGGAAGAMAVADIDLTKLNSGLLFPILGGMGHNGSSDDAGGGAGVGGAGGGGNGGGAGAGGGGRTALCKSFSATDEVLVAGGASWTSAGNSGNYNGQRVTGSPGQSGSVFNSTLNNSYPADGSGGGGGYYGGNGGVGDSPSTGSGGSSWADPAVCTNVTLPVGGAPEHSSGFAVFTILKA